jgi:signal peptidase I
MGDNRNNSSDSRTLGLIPDEEIMGEAIFRFMPFDKIGIIK